MLYRCRLGCAIVLGAIWSTSGCGSPENVPCTNMSGVSALVDQAQSFRVDVYGADASCNAPPTGPAQATFQFGRGDAIDFQVPPGTHTVLLTAFADTAEQTPLATACAQRDFSAQAKVCLDFQLSPVGDQGTGGDAGQPIDFAGDDLTGVDLEPPPDLTVPACPPTAVMCGSGASAACCDPANGSCSSACVLTCTAGFGNCDGYTANGCEASLTTATRCTSCNIGCDTVNAVGASCDGTKCNYAGCNANRQNCDSSGIDSNGCECEGNACCGTSCQTKHSDGYGDSFYDCQPLNTYNQTQAVEAEHAFDPTGNFDPLVNPYNYSDNKGTGSAMCVRSTARNTCVCFTYAATGNYAAYAGHSYSTGKPTGCSLGLVGPVNQYPAWN